MPALLPPHLKLKKLNESVTLRCALGIIFRDTATNQIVRTGLRATARATDAPPNSAAVTARPNPSGVWLFYNLPGLRMFELGTGDFPRVGSPPGAPRFRIEVEDEEGRFLPCTFVATASETGPMEFEAYLSSPPERKEVPLFSEPERPVPSASAVIRTRLVTEDQQPARWALLQATATVRNRPIEVLGVANSKGDVALIFPWPELVGLTISLSPPGRSRSEPPSWDLDFVLWHEGNFGNEDFADLDVILGSRSGAPREALTQLSPPVLFTAAPLPYGRELLLPDGPEPVAHTLIIR